MSSFDLSKFIQVGVKDSNISKYYLVSVTSSVLKKTVIGYLGSVFNEQIRSDWKQIMDIMGTPGGGLEALSQAFGVSTKTTNMFKMYWDRNEPLSLSFTMIFRAFEDAYKEVELPILVLEAIASPTKAEFLEIDIPIGSNKTIKLGGSLLKPPGPNPLGEGGDLISIVIGGRTFNEVVITQVRPERSMVRNKNGYPLFAKVNVEARMSYPLARQDILGE